MRRKYSRPLIVICAALLVSLALIDAGQLWGQRANAPALTAAGANSYVFRLQLENEVMDDYTECLGLGSSNDIEQAAAVTDAGMVVVEKAPGTLHWQNITLRRDSPSDPEVWQWRKAMEDLNLDLAIRDGSIAVLTGGSLEPVAQWTFRNGWAARLTFSGSQEELVIAHEGLERGGAPRSFPPARR